MNSNSRTVLYQQLPYIPPPWLAHFSSPIDSNTKSLQCSQPFEWPATRYNLGQIPTPIHSLKYSDFSGENNENKNSDLIKKSLTNYDFHIKRDDMTSFDVSGNKLRKLEFILAHAKNSGYNSVITIGGLQSNHCRATALAAKQVGLKCYLILRTSDSIESVKENLTGNLLFNRISDADIYMVTPSTYAQIGSALLTKQLQNQLLQSSANCADHVGSDSSSFRPNPYIIPVGGSDEIGLFGYLDCVNEIVSSSEHDAGYDHVVFACGSGGTAAGLGLGFRLVELYQQHVSEHKVYKRPQVHAVHVCDSPEYFYGHIEQTCHRIGLSTSDDGSKGTKATYVGDPRSWINIHRGVGIGYARSTDEELDFILQFGRLTGLLLDPVYSGKAMYYFLKDVLNNSPETSDNAAQTGKSVFKMHQKILFVHTGGVFGLYDKSAQLLQLLNQPSSPNAEHVFKMKVDKPS